ncbi:hypothetical protein HK104_003048 [Borealophlyctis nickersoniae]|nr:hypothetical protein HK104_003048 [Borealophlyctis nickersoniae]
MSSLTAHSNPNIAIAREYYGFVVYLASFVVFAIYLVWAILPDSALKAVGITYYPTRHWALVIPIWILGLIPFTILMFIGTVLWRTSPLDSLYTITDEYASPMQREDQIKFVAKDTSVPDLQDVPLAMVNRCMFEEPIRRPAFGNADKSS